VRADEYQVACRVRVRVTLRLTVCQSVRLGVEPTLGLNDQMSQSDYNIYNIMADHEVGVGCDRAHIVTYCYLSTNRYLDTDLGACCACGISPHGKLYLIVSNYTHADVNTELFVAIGVS
jgi:hypothetical protein